MNIPQLYVQILSKDLPAEEKKVKGIAMTIAPIMPPAIMKNTSLLNEKSTLAYWGFILLTISTRMLLTCILKDIKISQQSVFLKFQLLFGGLSFWWWWWCSPLNNEISLAFSLIASLSLALVLFSLVFYSDRIWWTWKLNVFL